MKKFRKTLKAAFPLTIPVLTGYFFIGIAFGVMFQEKGYNFLWAALMSILVYAGSGQYLAVNFFVPGISLIQVVVMILMINVRHIFYGLSMIEPFQSMGKKKWYMIFSLTDETYSLLCCTKVPEQVDKNAFLFTIALLNQLYWIIGSVIGAVAGSFLPFSSEGIEFAMTALFVVIFVENWMKKENRMTALVGVTSALLCRWIFPVNNFILPSMCLMFFLLMIGRKNIFREFEKGNGEVCNLEN